MTNANEVVCLKIELNDGQYDFIKVKEHDEPDDLARSFCEKYNLDNKTQFSLSNLIEFHIDNALESERSSFNQVIDVNSLSPIKSSNLSAYTSLSADENKLDLYYALFENLSDPGTYKISYDSINLSYLSKSIQRILEPIIDELQESREIIGFSEFTRAMDTLLPTLNARDRILLLNNYLEGNSKNIVEGNKPNNLENCKVPFGINKNLKLEIENLKSIRQARSQKKYDQTLSKIKSFK
jgi:hypothetical protein